MSEPYTISDIYNYNKPGRHCENEDCDECHMELPNGEFHHYDCDCDACALHAYLYLK